MPNPACEVKDGAGAYQATTNGVDVTPANTITIRRIDTSADSWSIECVYTDDTSDAAAVTSSLTINQALRTATFTAPAAGKTYIFRSRVNNGVGPNGRVLSSYSTTFGIYTLTSGGDRVLAANETTEGGPFGWVEPINNIIRSGPGGGADLPIDLSSDSEVENTLALAHQAAEPGTVAHIFGADLKHFWGDDYDATTGSWPDAAGTADVDNGSDTIPEQGNINGHACPVATEETDGLTGPDITTLDGLNSYVIFGCWRADSFGQGGIITKGGTQFAIELSGSNLAISCNGGSNGSLFSSTVDCDDGKWHRFIWNVDAGAGQLFIDGLLEDTGAFTAMPVDTGPVLLGTSYIGPSPIIGAVTSVGIVTRAATALELTRLDRVLAAWLHGVDLGEELAGLVPSDAVNVMTYWQDGDDEPTIDTHKTIGISAAIQRAWDQAIVTKKFRRVFIPPIALYSAKFGNAVAFSTKAPLSLDCSLVWTFGFCGSGIASPIIPDRSAALDVKFEFQNGGAKGMPTLFEWHNMFFVGNETTGVPATDADCVSILQTSAEMQVSYKGNIIYGCQGDGTAPGLINLSCSGAVLEKNFFVNCGMNSNESLLHFQGGTFGFHMQSTHFYTSKHYGAGGAGDLVNPFGGTGWTKTDATPWWMSTKGDEDVGHAPFIKIKNCTFGSSSGVYGCLKIAPDGWYVRNVTLEDCWITGNINKVIEAQENVDHIELLGCQIQLNGAFDIIDLQDPSVKRLTMRHTRIMTIGGATNPDSTVAANSGQESVIVEQCEGGTWDLTACDHYDVDESSMALVDAITLPGASSTEAVNGNHGLLRITVADSATYDLDGVEQAVASIQIDGTGAGSRTVRYEPTSDARAYTRYVRNNTPGDLIVDDTGGSGETVTIPTLEARQVWFTDDGATSGTAADPAAALDLTDLSWDILLYDYAGAPWTGIASAGPSASNDFVTDGADPSVGTALNGHGVATFNGTTNKLKSETGLDLGATATASAWSLCCVFKPSSTQTSPIPSQPASDQCLYVNIDGIHGISSTDQGARAWQYDGDYSPATAPTAATASAWAYLFAYRDGTGKVYTRLIKSGVDGGWSAGTTTDADWGGEATTFLSRLGADYTGVTSFYAGDMALFGASKTAFTTGEWDDVKDALNTLFGLSF